jgi:glyoxylase-like metal-dependent hydrolase (beta-lactamase superfamily II)
MSRAPAGRMQTVFKNARRVLTPEVLKRIQTYEPGKEIVAGITSVETNGHSWGHNSHIVASGKDKVFVQADVTHVPHLFARNPGWHAFYDQDGPKAEATRRRVYDMLVAERMLVQGFHYPFPGIAYVEKAGDGYREIPLPWSPTI